MRNLTLLTDLYELTMMQGYFKTGNNRTVIFDAFHRNNPCGGGYAIACGLDQVIDYIKNLHLLYKTSLCRLVRYSCNVQHVHQLWIMIFLII